MSMRMTAVDVSHVSEESPVELTNDKGLGEDRHGASYSSRGSAPTSTPTVSSRLTQAPLPPGYHHP